MLHDARLNGAAARVAAAFVAENRRALTRQPALAQARYNPVDALAHEDLRDALIELGRRAEARAEWQRVLQLDTGRNARQAREILAKHP